jgi:hypothetical protein
MGLPTVFALLHARLTNPASGAVELRVKTADKTFTAAVLAGISGKVAQ